MAQEEKFTDRAVISAAPAERTHFNKLVLANPNYFGTFPKFGGVVKKPVSHNTTYEHLACVGLNPGGFFGTGLLEAVIDITQHTGYGSDGCGKGSTEYVRFFVEHGSVWHDLGLSSVQVFDVPGSRPLSYAVSVDFNEAHKYCKTENILNVRAILSWQWAPTPGDPNFTPVWGNVIDAKVQVAPASFLHASIGDLVNEGVFSIDPGLLKTVDLTQTLAVQAPQPLSFAQLKQEYATTNVPVHRYGFKEASKLAGQSLSSVFNVGLTIPGATPGISLSQLTDVTEVGAALNLIADTSGDTTYEQLTCAGYNPQTRELEGVIHVKKNAGYSGSLCTSGSTEYVSFYAFFNGVWNPLGTTQVQVHDLAAVSAGHPVSYAVFRLSNLTSLPCEKLDAVPLRAILSWEVVPTGPNFVPVWGNVVETYVQPQIAPLDSEQSRIMRIGRVTVNAINAAGFAIPVNPTTTGDCVGNLSPFGGETIVEGDFLPRLDVFDHTTGALLPGAKPIIYQAFVTPMGGTRSQLQNTFDLALFPPNSMSAVPQKQKTDLAPGPVAVPPASNQFYTYWESDLQAVNPRTLAVVEASGLADGPCLIEIQGYKWDGLAYQKVGTTPEARTIYIYNGFSHQEITAGGTVVTVQRPQVSLTITSPSGDCGDVQVGDVIHGSYKVTDLYFDHVTLWLVPITVSGVPQPAPSVVLVNPLPPPAPAALPNPITYDGSNTTGVSGTFTLDTTGMTPCGYTIVLEAWDRALVSGNCSGHENDEAVGFCLRKKES